MAKKSSSKKPSDKTKKKSYKSDRPERRKEWRFELPLSTIVEGDLPKGNTFEEETILENISSTGAYFCLDSGITVGSKLNLVIDLPPSLTEGKKIKMALGGLTVRLEKINREDKQQGVALRFDEDFHIISVDKEKKAKNKKGNPSK